MDNHRFRARYLQGSSKAHRVPSRSQQQLAALVKPTPSHPGSQLRALLGMRKMTLELRQKDAASVPEARQPTNPLKHTSEGRYRAQSRGFHPSLDVLAPGHSLRLPRPGRDQEPGYLCQHATRCRESTTPSVFFPFQRGEDSRF